MFGGYVGYNLTDHWGLEGSALLGTSEIHKANVNGSGTLNSKYDADIFIPALDAHYNFGTSAFRPYVSAGLSNLNIDPDFKSNLIGVNPNSTDELHLQYGVGLKWIFRDAFSARVALQHWINTENHYHVLGASKNNGTITAGLSWLFGGCGMAAPVEKPKAVVAAPVVSDGDHDGVIDAQDSCPDSPAGSQVDAKGCATLKDTDGDGVMDDRDQCAATPTGLAVDMEGCPAEVAKAMPKAEWVLSGVQFETGSATLKASAKAELDQASGILNANPTARVEVQGHTDNVGKAESNQKLSDARANAVKAYLISKGIASDRLEDKGYGQTQPKSDNGTKEGRAANRRIEFKVLSR